MGLCGWGSVCVCVCDCDCMECVGGAALIAAVVCVAVKCVTAVKCLCLCG